MSVESIPKDLRNLRACLLCSMVKTFEQFEFDGCDNCEEYLGIKGNRDLVYDCTSSNFDGLISAMNPEDSWVCKWQRINRYTKGVYAISVSGRLPQGIVRELKSRGIIYKSRDTSTR
uniref:Transcription elongation factor SPT4 n=1 Tax=Strigamia maritima TaxID=126957 RepID=T1JM37_STRMM